MRKFGTDAPEFFVFQIGDDEKTYKIPMLGSLTVKEIEEMDQADKNGEGMRWQLNFLRKHMGKETVDNLPSGVAGDILKEWSRSTTDQGATAGES